MACILIVTPGWAASKDLTAFWKNVRPGPGVAFVQKVIVTLPPEDEPPEDEPPPLLPPPAQAEAARRTPRLTAAIAAAGVFFIIVETP
jgi:hypothetical protein